MKNKKSVSTRAGNAGHVEFFVSPGGKDTNPGTRNAPFSSLARARDAVRKFKAKKQAGPITVTLRQGIYNLENSFELTKQDSGTAEAPVAYRSENGERVILTGGRRIGKFTPVKDRT